VPFPERLLTSYTPDSATQPLLTIAIPHYKQRRYLEIVLKSLFVQTSDDFEIVVSDDCSPDDSAEVIPQQLHTSGRRFRYYLQPQNLGYDGNVRFCLAAGQGHYVMLLGNDDAIAYPDSLQQMAAMLRQLGLPEVAFTNYVDAVSGTVTRRAHQTRVLGAGPAAAILSFRNLSFVSGLIFDQASTARYETDRWDRSIFYQIYIACRIIAAGGRLASLDLNVIRKDIRLDGQTVTNYVTITNDAIDSYQPRHIGIDSVIRVTIDAVVPLVPVRDASATMRSVIAQILLFSYVHWLIEYRRLNKPGFAVGIARGMWPGTLLAEYRLATQDRFYLWLLYFVGTIIGLILPLHLLTHMRGLVANIIRRRQQRTAKAT
jgi:glycosyltransferase involved in cell wall biosynthesis